MNDNNENPQEFEIVEELNTESTQEILIETESQNISEIIEVTEPLDVDSHSQSDFEPQINNDLPPTIEANSVIGMFAILNQKFDTKIATDIHKNQLFDKMYSELQSLKDDTFKKAIKPIFMDLIVFIDFMRNLACKYDEQPSEENLLATYQKLRGEFAKGGDHIEDLLYNYGIESFTSNNGDVFDPKNQQAKKTTIVENEEANKLIVESFSSGYIWSDMLLRKESVHINVNTNTNK